MCDCTSPSPKLMNPYRYTCGGRFGSLDHEDIDAKTYAEWGVDYLSMRELILCNDRGDTYTIALEYDNCFNEGRAGTPKLSFDRYAKMSDALNATRRPILYSLCNWGEDGPWNFASVSA